MLDRLKSAAGALSEGHVEPGPRVPAGSLRDDDVTVQFAVYLLQERGGDLAEQAVAVARRHAPELRIAQSQDSPPALPALHVGLPPIAEYSPPDAGNLRYTGRGLDDDLLLRVPRATGVVVLTVAAASEGAGGTHRALLQTVHELAIRWDGVLWDEATREVFSPHAWKETRLTWRADPPRLSDHITMHAYRDGELIRIVTLGMGKFGLPDMVVNDVSSGDVRGIGNLINLATQTLHEQPAIAEAGRLPVSIDEIASASEREEQQSKTLDNAKRGVVLDVLVATPEEGDPENRLLEIFFAADGRAPQVGHNQVVSTLYGSHDEISSVSHDNTELMAASARAVTALMKLKPGFGDGPDVNEQLLVKAPFKTPGGGNEWMWVEVVSWQGSAIKGILANDPFDVPDLQAGATVRVDESTVFDYMHRRPDGSQVGNETGAIIQRSRTGTRTQ